MISLLFPKRPCPDEETPRLGLSWVIRILLLVTIITVLTWVAKFRETPRITSREHGLTAWFFATPAGITTYLIFPDDHNDSNDVNTGLRLLLNPPANPSPIGLGRATFFQGPMVVLPDSGLADSTIEHAKTLLSPGEELLTEKDLNPNWLVHLGGKDLQSQYGGFGHARLKIQWQGFQIVWWKTLKDLQQDTLPSTLSLAILEECIPHLDSLPELADPTVAAWIYCGPASPDSSRIALGKPGIAVGLSEDNGKLLTKAMHLYWDSVPGRYQLRD